MGNAAAKELNDTQLNAGTIKVDDVRSIAKGLVTTSEETTKIKSKGKKWVRYNGKEETLLWSTQNVGMFKCHSVISDAEGKIKAVIVKEKRNKNFVCKDTPSYDGQEPLSGDELKNYGMPEDATAYKFARIDTTRTLTTASCKYGLVTSGSDEVVTPLYEGEKLSSLGFKALFRENGTVIAKANTPGISMTPHCEIASGVDMLAIVSMGYSLAGDESSAGALAGAGVV